VVTTSTNFCDIKKLCIFPQNVCTNEFLAIPAVINDYFLIKKNQLDAL